MTARFPILIEAEATGAVSAYVPDLPVYAGGNTAEQAERAIRDLLACYLTDRQAKGLPLPASRTTVKVARSRATALRSTVAIVSSAASLGRERSPRKAAAARRNGLQGGRPRLARSGRSRAASHSTETVMLISKELNAAFNEEIGLELFASNQYLNIAAYFGGLGLKKLAGMFFKQAEEERAHAIKFVRYLDDVGGSVEIPAVQAPTHAFASVEEAVALALHWELEVTARINAMMTLAVDQRDYAAQDFLRWFVTEQVEEVSTMENLLKVVRVSGERSLLMVEAYLVHNE